MAIYEVIADRHFVAAAPSSGLRAGLIVAALAFGFRHGIDWDHLAAISDIAGSQTRARRSVVLATLYALGHALVVVVLGVLAIGFSERLPAGIDGMMERFVGVTLLLLGVYVLWGLVRHGRDFRMRSRWMLVIEGVRRGMRRLRGGEPEMVVIEHRHDHDHAPNEDHIRTHSHERARVAVVATESVHRHRHRHVARMPDDPFVDYGRPTAFGIGMLHGVGAETPTQVLIFVAAAGAAGTGVGLLLLVCFVVGLLVANTFIALAVTSGYLAASGNSAVYLGVAAITGVCSLIIGAQFVLGASSTLPALFGG